MNETDTVIKFYVIFPGLYIAFKMPRSTIINKQCGGKSFMIFFSSKANSGLSHLSEALVKSSISP